MSSSIIMEHSFAWAGRSSHLVSIINVYYKTGRLAFTGASNTDFHRSYGGNERCDFRKTDPKTKKINLSNPPIHPLSNILIRCTPAYFRKKMDDSRKLRSIIEEIRNKEEKIKCLQRTRERDMSECRLRAHSAAELREQIR